AGVIGLPPANRSRPHQLLREVASLGDVAQLAEHNASPPPCPMWADGRGLPVVKFESCHPLQTGRRSLVIATPQTWDSQMDSPEFRDPGAAIAHAIAVSPGRNHLPA